MKLYYAENFNGEMDDGYGKRIEMPLDGWLDSFRKNCIHLGFEGDSYKIVRFPTIYKNTREQQYAVELYYLRPVK